MSIDHDHKTISWKAAYDLIMTADAILFSVNGKTDEINFARSSGDNVIYILSYHSSSGSYTVSKNENENVEVTKHGNLLVKSRHKLIEVVLLTQNQILKTV